MIPTVRICLIDDEPPCRDALRIFLETGCPEAVVAGEAGSLAEGTALIQQVHPDIILLDVDLGDGTGFDLLNRFPEPAFRMIFTTAHDEFALRAFRYSAVDYLLKPVDPEELVADIRRVLIPSDAPSQLRQLQQLYHQASTRSFLYGLKSHFSRWLESHATAFTTTPAPQTGYMYPPLRHFHRTNSLC